MFYSPILFLSISITSIWIIYELFGKNYALDEPNIRKRHTHNVPQIGGLVFGLLLLLIGWWLGFAPRWYLIGGLVSILLGTTDDLFHISWHVKLLVQLILTIYIAINFWGTFSNITFYNFSIMRNKFNIILQFCHVL